MKTEKWAFGSAVYFCERFLHRFMLNYLMTFGIQVL